MSIRKGLLMVVLQRVGLAFKKILSSIRGSPIKFLLSYLRLVIIRCINLGPKTEELKTHLMRSLLVPCVEKVISVND